MVNQGKTPDEVKAHVTAIAVKLAAQDGREVQNPEFLEELAEMVTKYTRDGAVLPTDDHAEWFFAGALDLGIL